MGVNAKEKSVAQDSGRDSLVAIGHKTYQAQNIIFGRADASPAILFGVTMFLLITLLAVSLKLEDLTQEQVYRASRIEELLERHDRQAKDIQEFLEGGYGV